MKLREMKLLPIRRAITGGLLFCAFSMGAYAAGQLPGGADASVARSARAAAISPATAPPRCADNGSVRGEPSGRSCATQKSGVHAAALKPVVADEAAAVERDGRQGAVEPQPPQRINYAAL